MRTTFAISVVVRFGFLMRAEPIPELIPELIKERSWQ